MGEFAISIFIGGWMIFLGVFMNTTLSREEKSYKKNQSTEYVNNKAN